VSDYQVENATGAPLPDRFVVVREEIIWGPNGARRIIREVREIVSEVSDISSRSPP